MNILGIGGMELAVILLIMLIIAGPKRMVRWAYIAGTYVSKMRAMWEETMSYLQKEFDDAGLDVKLPKEPPTRGSLNTQFRKTVDSALSPVTQPVREALDEVNKTSELAKGNGRKTVEKPPAPPSTPPASGSSSQVFGTWSGGSTPGAAGATSEEEQQP